PGQLLAPQGLEEPGDVRLLVVRHHADADGRGPAAEVRGRAHLALRSLEVTRDTDAFIGMAPTTSKSRPLSLSERRAKAGGGPEPARAASVQKIRPSGSDVADEWNDREDGPTGDQPADIDSRNSRFAFVLASLSSISSMASTGDSGFRTLRRIQTRLS